MTEQAWTKELDDPGFTNWKADAVGIQNAARTLACYYFGDAWQHSNDNWCSVVEFIARLIADAPAKARALAGIEDPAAFMSTIRELLPAIARLLRQQHGPCRGCEFCDRLAAADARFRSFGIPIPQPADPADDADSDKT